MKVKNIFITAVALGIFGCLTTNCSFLDTYDPSTVTTDYYDTKEGQERLIYNLYSRCRSIYSDMTLQYLGTDMYMASSQTPTFDQFNGYSKDLSGLSGLDSYWKLHYRIIKEANILLDRCTEEIAGEDYARMTAEARFFRALSYYYLVETFGPVPLIIKDQDEIITKVTRTPEADIYSFLIEELDAIEGVLPEAATEIGRLNDAAIRLFYGKLLLTRSYRDYAQGDDLTNAINLFESVINSEVYTLLPDFASVFSEDNQHNDEIIWAIQYGSDKNFMGSGNSMHTQFCFNICGLYPGDFIQAPNEYPSAQRNIWVNPIVHEWFRHPDKDVRYDVTFKREFYINDPTSEDYGKLGIYLPLWNDESGDDRGAKYYYPFYNEEGGYNWVPAVPMLGYTTDCMPMCIKFQNTTIDWGMPGTREDIVFRMADAYFLAAEAYIMNDQPDKAMEKVNVILERAAGHDAEVYELLKIQSPEEMTMDRLLEEKGCECFGEHDRWFDLKRTGTLLERGYLNPFVQYFNNLQEMHLVRPIPYNERIKLEGLDQNEGYLN